jgi:hypothetical protein
MPVILPARSSILLPAPGISLAALAAGFKNPNAPFPVAIFDTPDFNVSNNPFAGESLFAFMFFT